MAQSLEISLTIQENSYGYLVYNKERLQTGKENTDFPNKYF